VYLHLQVAVTAAPHSGQRYGRLAASIRAPHTLGIAACFALATVVAPSVQGAAVAASHQRVVRAQR